MGLQNRDKEFNFLHIKGFPTSIKKKTFTNLTTIASLGINAFKIFMFVNCFEVCFKIFEISTCRYGTLCIRENPGCLFIATNLDAVGHMTDLQEWPGLPFFFSLFSLSSISMIT